MKKLTQISLHNLSQAELAKKEENLLRGGEYTCACAGAGCLCASFYQEGTELYWNDQVTIDTEVKRFDEEVTMVVYKNNLN